jgi:hypothetical protein
MTSKCPRTSVIADMVRGVSFYDVGIPTCVTSGTYMFNYNTSDSEFFR